MDLLQLLTVGVQQNLSEKLALELFYQVRILDQMIITLDLAKNGFYGTFSGLELIVNQTIFK